MGFLNKILLVIIIILVIFGGTFFMLHKSVKDKANRIEVAYGNLEKDNKLISLKHKELTNRQKIQIIKLTDSLKIKPKFVTEYVYIKTTDTITLIDTIYKEGKKINPGIYSFNQDTGCFHIEWVVDAINKIPKSALTNLIYDNKIEYLVYLKRREKKFWFIKYKSWFKKDATLETFSKCGESKVEVINIIKK